MTYGILSGVRVVESSAFIAAPLAGLTLAQWGADVIRIDAIGGGIDYRRMPQAGSGRSLYWTGLNKGKRSFAVDLRSGEGRELVAALVTAEGQGGGVLLTNIGVPWLGHGVLAGRRPDVISCVIEGNPDGSSAVDYTVNCATGLPAMTGNGSIDRPVNSVLPAWDIACALQASTAICAALLQRRERGSGAELRIALSDVAFATVSHLGLLAEAEVLAVDRPSLGNGIYGAFGMDFATADGRRFMVAAISVRQWTSLVEACAMGPQIAAIEAAYGLDFHREKDRFKGRDLIAALVRLWSEGRTMDDIAGTFKRHDVCWGEYRTVSGLLADDWRASLANPLFEQVDTPGIGPHRAAGNVARLAGATRSPTAPAPWLGAHTDAILGDVLGLPAHAIGQLHDRGVVAGPARDPFFQAS